jgi:hypothetical protein
LNRFRPIVLGAACAVALLAGRALEASAAAEVHKMNLVISANPTSMAGGGFNDRLGDFNDLVLAPRGNETIKPIEFGWLYEGELRYFVRQNVALVGGVGFLSSESKREFLPAILASINIRAQVETIPVHLGATYYLAPYNQGDFQARTYLGGGILTVANTQVHFSKDEVGTDSLTTYGGLRPGGSSTYEVSGQRGGPGYYLEAGAHMFFASRWSVLIGAGFRDVKVRGIPLILSDQNRFGTPETNAFETTDLDLRGGSFRMAVAYGL